MVKKMMGLAVVVIVGLLLSPRAHAVDSICAKVIDVPTSEYTVDSNTWGLWHMNSQGGEDGRETPDAGISNRDRYAYAGATLVTGGMFGKGYDLNSTKRYSGLLLNYDEAAWAELGDEFTIEGFVKFDDLWASAYEDFIYAEGWYRYILAYGDALRFGLSTDEGSASFYTPYGTLTTGQWYHIAMTYDGSTMRGFLDGVEVGSAPIHGSCYCPARSHIGGRTYEEADYFMDGMVDEWRISTIDRSRSGDTVPPELTCVEPSLLYADDDCKAELPAIEYMVTDNCDSDVAVAQVPAAGTRVADGTTVTLTAVDDSGNPTTCQVTVTVQDITPPTISWTDPGVVTTGDGQAELWPPNHRWVTFTATDACAGVSITAIAGLEDELTRGAGGWKHDPDVQYDEQDESRVSIRAERSGRDGDGRVYGIVATDASGNTTTLVVTVPHDQR